MLYQPTTEQRLASNPNHHVWVTAHAGTGKTRILTDRVLRMIMEGVPPEQILCITFTKAAANEMKERITHTLLRYATHDTNSVSKEITLLLDVDTISKRDIALIQQRALLLIDHPNLLNIRTIHSLCQSILQQFPLEFDALPSNFSVIDDQQQAELLSQSRNRLLEGLELTLIDDPILRDSLHFLASQHKETTFTGVLNLAIQHRDRFQSLLSHHGSVEDYLQHLQTTLELDDNSSTDTLLDNFFIRYDDTFFKRLESILFSQEKLSSTDLKAHKNLHDLLSTPDAFTRFNACKRLTLTQKHEPKKSIFTKAVLKELPTDLAEQLSQCQQDALHSYHQLEHQSLYQQTAALLHISEALMAIYAHLKLENNVMDNTDLIFAYRTIA